MTREELPLVELDAVVEHLAHGVSGRRKGAADLPHVRAQLAEPVPHLASGSRGNHVLELVDLVVEVVDQIEVALGDLVDEVVDVHADVLVGAARFLRRPRVERPLSGRRLRDRDEDVGRRDQVDLLVVDPVFVLDCDRDQEDAEYVGAVRLQSRSGLVVLSVRGEQRRQRRGVDVRREVRLELVPRGVDQIDPT